MNSQNPVERKRRRTLVIALLPLVIIAIWITWLWCFDSALPDDAHLFPEELASIAEEENAFVAFMQLDAGDISIEQQELVDLWSQWCVDRWAGRPTYYYGSEAEVSFEDRPIEDFYDFEKLKQRLIHQSVDLEAFVQQLEGLATLPYWRWQLPEDSQYYSKLRNIRTLLRLQLCLCAERRDVDGLTRTLDVTSRLLRLQLNGRPKELISLLFVLILRSAISSDVDTLMLAAGSDAKQLARVQVMSMYDTDYRMSLAAVHRDEYVYMRRNMLDPYHLEATILATQAGKTKPNRTLALLAHDLELVLNLPVSDTWREQLYQLNRLKPSAVQSFFQSATGNSGGYFVLESWHGSVAGVHAKSFRACCDSILQVTALALLRFEQERGALPQSLTELVPDYLSELQRDIYDGQPLRYSPDRRCLYSVGEDFNDDGGNPEEVDDNLSSFAARLG